MKTHLLALTLLLPTFATAEPGLIGEYFQLKEKLGDEHEIPVGQKPWLVRADAQINFPEVSGDFYGAKLSDSFMVRWSGNLKVEKEGGLLLLHQQRRRLPPPHRQHPRRRQLGRT